MLISNEKAWHSAFKTWLFHTSDPAISSADCSKIVIFRHTLLQRPIMQQDIHTKNCCTRNCSTNVMVTPFPMFPQLSLPGQNITPDNSSGKVGKAVLQLRRKTEIKFEPIPTPKQAQKRLTIFWQGITNSSRLVVGLIAWSAARVDSRSLVILRVYCSVNGLAFSGKLVWSKGFSNTKSKSQVVQSLLTLTWILEKCLSHGSK